MDIVKLTDSKLDVNEIYLQVVASSTGAASLFVGTTRDTFENKKASRQLNFIMVCLAGLNMLLSCLGGSVRI